MLSVVCIVFFSSTLTTNSLRSPLVHPPSHGCRSTHNSPIHTATGSRLTQNFSVSVPTLIYTGTRLLRLQSWGSRPRAEWLQRAGRQVAQAGPTSLCFLLFSLLVQRQWRILYLAAAEALPTWKWKCSSSFQSLFHRSSKNPILCVCVYIYIYIYTHIYIHTYRYCEFGENPPVCIFAVISALEIK